jgi:hypothetical protein
MSITKEGKMNLKQDIERGTKELIRFRRKLLTYTNYVDLIKNLRPGRILQF